MDAETEGVRVVDHKSNPGRANGPRTEAQTFATEIIGGDWRLRRSLAELRKLRTERHTRILSARQGEDVGLIESGEARVAEIEARRRRREGAIDEYLAARSFCNPPATPGKNAPPVLNRAS
jgi:hypothetical protein